MTYYDRDVLLHQMGYSTYSEYLNSELWAKIRAAAFKAHGGVCKICRGTKKPAKVIHHLDYSLAVLEGSDISQLVPLCHGCHKKVEMNHRGEKRTMEGSVRAFQIAKRKSTWPVKKPRHKCLTCKKKVHHKKKYCTKCKKRNRATPSE